MTIEPIDPDEEQPVIPTDITVDKAHYEDLIDRCAAAEKKRDAMFAVLVIKDRTTKALLTGRQHLTNAMEQLCLAVLTGQEQAAEEIAKASLRALKPMARKKPPTSDPSDSSSPTPLMNTSQRPPEPDTPSQPMN